MLRLEAMDPLEEGKSTLLCEDDDWAEGRGWLQLAHSVGWVEEVLS